MTFLRFVAAGCLLCVGVAAAPRPSDETVVRTPSMPESKLLRKVDPEYPSVALQNRIQGTVRFNAMIGKDGHVEYLRLLSGHPLLVRAAQKAVQQWIYRPTLLGDQPVRVITIIEVHFQLDVYGNPLKTPSEKPIHATFTVSSVEELLCWNETKQSFLDLWMARQELEPDRLSVFPGDGASRFGASADHGSRF